MMELFEELMSLAGIPLEEAETPNPQLPNLNLDGKKIVSPGTELEQVVDPAEFGDAAAADVAAGKGNTPPRTLQNVHFDGENASQKGQNYKYPHDYKNHYVKQQYLPESLADASFYQPTDIGYEKNIKENLEKIRQEAE